MISLNNVMAFGAILLCMAWMLAIALLDGGWLKTALIVAPFGILLVSWGLRKILESKN